MNYTADMTDEQKRVYEQGQIAHEQCFSREQNPYLRGTWQHAFWDSGWCQSEDDLCGGTR